jgi:hypothetical protein
MFIFAKTHISSVRMAFWAYEDEIESPSYWVNSVPFIWYYE